MLKLKLIILGVLLSIVSAYSTPIGISPTVTKITNVTSSGFTVNWTPALITGLSSGSSYFISYDITVSGPGGTFKTTNSTSITFNGLRPDTYYTIKIQTHAQIIGGVESVSFSPVITSVTTSQASIPETNTVSTDYTKLSSQNVVLKAKSKIVFAPGFHYKATDGYSLVTQLSPNTKSSDAVIYDILDPENSYLEIDKQNVNLNNGLVVPEYEVIQPQQGSLLIRNKNFDYNASVKPGYYEIVDMNSGKLSKKGNLSGNETQIDVLNLKVGFYIIRVADGKQMYTQKITIRH